MLERCAGVFEGRVRPAPRAASGPPCAARWRLLHDRAGATTVEYVVLATLVGLVVFGGVRTFGQAIAGRVDAGAKTIAGLDFSGAPPVPRELPKPPPRPAPPKQEDDGGLWGWVRDAGEVIGTVAYELSPVSDIVTLFDPNASLLDKGLALAGLIPGPGQAVKWGAKAVKVGAKVADGVSAGDKAKDGQKASDAATPDDPVPPSGERRRDTDDGEREPDAQNGGGRGGSGGSGGTGNRNEADDRGDEGEGNGDGDGAGDGNETSRPRSNRQQDPFAQDLADAYRWHDGGWATSGDNLTEHHARHMQELGGVDVSDYAAMAGHARDLRRPGEGTPVPGQTPNVYRYQVDDFEYNGTNHGPVFVDLQIDPADPAKVSIISFGTRSNPAP